jgi:hypothetical protein
MAAFSLLARPRSSSLLVGLPLVQPVHQAGEAIAKVGTGKAASQSTEYRVSRATIVIP